MLFNKYQFLITARKQIKAKRTRTAYTSNQLFELEREFNIGRYLCRARRIQIAKNLNLSEKQIKVWFQNRRMKDKKENKSESGKAVESIDTPKNSPSDSAKTHSLETTVCKTDNDSKSSTWMVPNITETAGPSYMHPSDVLPNNNQIVKNYEVPDRYKEAQNYPSTSIRSAYQTQIPFTSCNILQNDVHYVSEDRDYVYQQQNTHNYGAPQSQPNNNYLQWNNSNYSNYSNSIDLQNANSYAPKLNSCASNDNANCLLNQNTMLPLQDTVYNDICNSENYMQL